MRISNTSIVFLQNGWVDPRPLFIYGQVGLNTTGRLRCKDSDQIESQSVSCSSFFILLNVFFVFRTIRFGVFGRV